MAQIICFSVALSIVPITRFHIYVFILFFLPFKKMNFIHQCVILWGNNTRNTPPPECANYIVLIKTITIIKYNYSNVNVLNAVISVIRTMQSLYPD